MTHSLKRIMAGYRVLAAVGIALAVTILAALWYNNPASAASYSSLQAGDVFICEGSPSVYYMGSDGLARAFPTQRIYNTWYSNFSRLITVPGPDCASNISLGGTVSVRPGTVLVQFPPSNRVYAVEAPNVIRHIISESVAASIFGPNWNQLVTSQPVWNEDLNTINEGAGTILPIDPIFYNYEEGTAITSASEYDRDVAIVSCRSINECLGLGTVPNRVVVQPEEEEQMEQTEETTEQQEQTQQESQDQDDEDDAPVVAPINQVQNSNTQSDNAILQAINANNSNPSNTSMSHMGMGGTRRQSPYTPPLQIANPITAAERLASMPFIDAAGLNVGPAQGGNRGRFYSVAHTSHYGYDDPIVYYGQSGASHLHMFLGNQTTDAYSTTESLLNSTLPSTARGNRLNQTAYWVPAMLDAAGNPVLVTPDTPHFLNYSSSVPDSLLRPFPEGLRMIAGRASAGPADPQDRLIVSWGCEGVANNDPASIPECPVGGHLLMVIRFPQCNNGQLDSANQQSHMAYPVYDVNTGQLGCPTSHPIAFPEVSIQITFPVTAEYGGTSRSTRGWHLASDNYDLTRNRGGYSAHADWFNGWDPVMVNRIINECLIPGNDCNNGSFPIQPGESRSREMVGPNFFALSRGRFNPGPFTPTPAPSPTPSPIPTPTPDPGDTGDTSDDSNDDDNQSSDNDDNTSSNDDNNNADDDDDSDLPPETSYIYYSDFAGYVIWSTNTSLSNSGEDGERYYYDVRFSTDRISDNPLTQANTTGYYRDLNTTNAYVALDPNEPTYVRVCLYDTVDDECEILSNEVRIDPSN